MTKEKLRRLMELDKEYYQRRMMSRAEVDESEALRAEFEAWEPEAAERRLRSALAVVADRLARWLFLPAGTRLADLREFVDDVLMADRESKG